MIDAPPAVGKLPTAGTWTVEPAYSSARFTVRHHAVASFHGAFSELSGEFDAAAKTLVGAVRVDRVELPGLPRLQRHILTPDFFMAEQHPTLSFASRAVRDGTGGVCVEGELTMRGTTRPVSARGTARGPVAVQHRDGGVAQHLGIDLSTVIDRRDFGIGFNTELPGGLLNLGWEVTIDVSLELSRSDGGQ